MVSKICLVCFSADKQADHQFCSTVCANAAASYALPQLLYVPDGHVFFRRARELFKETWDSRMPRPKLVAVYLITWPFDMRASFEAYRDDVGRRQGTRPEYRCFRAERRSCKLGDSIYETNLCGGTRCRLCRAIATGFQSSLAHKRDRVVSGGRSGIRFGGGIYMSPESDKAYQYAKDDHPYSEYRTVIITRTVLGKQQWLDGEDHGRMGPDCGYDSVAGRADGGLSTEYVVYNQNAVRPAFLLVLKPRDFV